MKQPVITLTATMMFLALGCEEETGLDEVANEPVAVEQDSRAIVNGYEADITEFPWQVSLLYWDYHSCGGAVLNKDWVLTAKHCVEPTGGFGFKVAAGITHVVSGRGVEGTIVNVAETILHPDAQMDLALLRLEQSLDLSNPSISAVSLVEMQDGAVSTYVKRGAYATVSGWGMLSYGANGPDRLNAVSVPLMTNNSIRQYMETQGQGADVFSGDIGAGYLRDTDRCACYGDSGSPLVVPNRWENGALLIGIVHYGKQDCTGPNTYSFVDQARDWIRSQIGCSAQAPGGGSYCSPQCPCSHGRGDCDTDADCVSGTVCSQNVGAAYGLPGTLDICENKTNSGSNGGASHCSKAKPCPIGHGDCDSNGECLPGLVCKNDIGATYGFASTIDVCERACTAGMPGGWDFCSPECPCRAGEGDCDSDADCGPDAYCHQNLGASFGWPADVDVCQIR